MSCYHPQYMIRRGLKENGKQDLVFASTIKANLCLSDDELINRYGDRLVPIPCGKCIGCQLDYSKQWAVRCVLESLNHDENSFITLTYDEKNCPEKLVKKHLSAFIKRLRAAHEDIRISFFGCGEYGSKNGRPHYHAIIFGYDFPDKKLIVHDDTSSLYESSELEKLWPFGISSVGDVSLQSCAYVARYSMKKVKKQEGSEFLLMSRRPAIGHNWFRSHQDIVYLSDHVYGAFGQSHVASVPRYFDKLADKYGIDLSEIKEARINRAMNNIELMKTLHQTNSAHVLNGITEDILMKRIESLRRYL